MVLAVAACHDARRESLLDPELTPAVDVTAALDDTAGTVTLEWEPYAGPAAFGEYRVLRQEADVATADTLVRLTDGWARSYVDSLLDPDATYLYSVCVINTAGLESKSAVTRVGPVRFPPVEVESVEFRSPTATAALTWRPYRGPRFASYGILRSEPGLIPQVVAELADRTVIAYNDSGLEGNTPYTYVIAVRTESGHDVPSRGVSGTIHELVDTWPLTVSEQDHIRLYADQPGRIEALVARSNRVSLLTLSTSGALLDEWTPLSARSLRIEPSSVSLTWDSEGRRLMTAVAERHFVLLAYSADGTAGQYRSLETSWSLTDLADDEQVAVGGLIALTAGSPGEVTFDNLRVSTRGAELSEEDFSGPLPAPWSLDSDAAVDDGRLIVTPQTRSSLTLLAEAATRDDEGWRDVRVEADVTTRRARAGLRIGLRTASVGVALDPETQEIVLEWLFGRTTGRDTRPFPVLDGLSYRLALEVIDGRITVEVASPIRWFAEHGHDGRWSTVATLGDEILVTDGASPWYLGAGDGPDQFLPELAAPIAEARIWRLAEEQTFLRWIGLALAQTNQILFARVNTAGRATWPFSLPTPTIGGTLGQGSGEFIFPLSFDASPDGRLFVVDAGNARVQAFDRDGRYVTQWGGRGAMRGQFDFGSGSAPADFSGSVAVDDEGFIYVAEARNRRVQKFAP